MAEVVWLKAGCTLNSSAFSLMAEMSPQECFDLFTLLGTLVKWGGIQYNNCAREVSFWVCFVQLYLHIHTPTYYGQNSLLTSLYIIQHKTTPLN